MHWQTSIWQLVQRMVILYWKRGRSGTQWLISFSPPLCLYVSLLFKLCVTGVAGREEECEFWPFFGHLSIKVHLDFHSRPSAFESVSFEFLSSSCFLPWQNHCASISTSYFHWFCYKFGWNVFPTDVIYVVLVGFQATLFSSSGIFLLCVHGFFACQEKT